MKYVLFSMILLTFFLFSCHEDEKTQDYPGLGSHSYFWKGMEGAPLIIPFSAFDQTFQLEDLDGYAGAVYGIPGMRAKDQHGDSTYHNIALTNGKDAIISDTIVGDWFTVINEHDKLRVSLKKNEDTEARTLGIAVWVRPTDSRPFGGVPQCDPLIIVQLPLENR